MTAREANYNDAAQLERTVLAWSRTSLALAANGALVAREGLLRDAVPLTAVGCAVIVVAALAWLVAIRGYAPAAERRSGHLVARHERAVAAAATFVGGLLLLDLVLVAT